MLPISALEHFVYCPRQYALIHVDGVWAENTHTLRGHHRHRRVDSGEVSTLRGEQIVRSVKLWSDQLGLIGRADAIHVKDGRVMPVEYKAGKRHGKAADVQLCAQALCLEEMLGVDVHEGAVWYDAHRRRERIPISGSLREETLRVIDRAKEFGSSRFLPDAPADERCDSCQLLGHCAPEVVANQPRFADYLKNLYSSPSGGSSEDT